jgi:hypothetical protein
MVAVLQEGSLGEQDLSSICELLYRIPCRVGHAGVLLNHVVQRCKRFRRYQRHWCDRCLKHYIKRTGARKGGFQNNNFN